MTGGSPDPAAGLIGHATAQTQVIAVTHSPILIDTLRRSAPNAPAELGTIELVKKSGETVVAAPSHRTSRPGTRHTQSGSSRT